MTPDDLLTAARRFVERPDAATAGVWPRAAAFLARQALEVAMAALWSAQPGAPAPPTSMRSQLLCLTTFVDVDTAARATYVFAALSRACHYHPYELAPNSTELTRWLTETGQIMTLIRDRDVA